MKSTTTARFAPHKAPVRKMRQKPDRAKKMFVVTCNMMNVRSALTGPNWMRLRWREHNESWSEHFAAMASLLRTTILVTEELDRVLKECQLSCTGYLILITLADVA